MKETWPKGSKQVCGMTKSTPRRFQTKGADIPRVYVTKKSLLGESGRKNCFIIARQMAKEGRDVITV